MTESSTHSRTNLAERLSRREYPQRVPLAVAAEPGLFLVDGTWGAVSPLELHPGVRTVGELELIEHVGGGGELIDTRPDDAWRLETIPGARNIPWRETLARFDELPEQPAVYFCNGPQCAATPAAIENMLAVAKAPETILYYRGGLHDWITLGYRTAPGLPA